MAKEGTLSESRTMHHGREILQSEAFPSKESRTSIESHMFSHVDTHGFEHMNSHP